MMILEKIYSYSSGAMINKLVRDLDKEKIEDYEVVGKIPTDTISIIPDQRVKDGIKIYIPEDMDYDQYDIDDYIRSANRFIRTNTGNATRTMLLMTMNGTLKYEDILGLVKKIIELEGFCSIVDINLKK
jgi:hypothetical protein